MLGGLATKRWAPKAQICLTDTPLIDRLPRPALEVRANSGKSSEEDCKKLLIRYLRKGKAYNEFHTVSLDFNHERVSNEAISLTGVLSVIRSNIRYGQSEANR